MKKIISIAMTLTMTIVSIAGFSSPLMEVFGAETDSKGLEQAIQAVKKVISIPDSFSDFQYYSNELEVDGEKQTMWNLTWSSKEGKGNIYASVDNRGQLVSFNQYEDNRSSGLSTFTRSEGEKIAAAFLNKARPDLASNMKSVVVDQYGGDSNFNYLFTLYANNIPVDFIYAKISVNKFTKKVEAFYMVQTGQQKLTYPGTADIISLEKAKEAFLKTDGISLKYFTFYDYSNKKLNVFPAFITDAQGTVIHAKTGEKVNIYYQTGAIGGPYATADSAGGQMNKINESLSPEETKAVENVSGLISKETAEKTVKELVSAFKTMTVNNASLTKDYREDKYFWMINFDKGSASINGKTGELISFYIYDQPHQDGKNISQETALGKAEAFIKKAAGLEKWNGLKLQEQRQLPGYPRPLGGMEKSISSIMPIYGNPDSYQFSYVRQVNGIDVIDNRTTITINNVTGEVMQYASTWFDSVTFPSIEQVMTPEKAFNLYNETGKLSLKYVLTAKDTPTLVYQFSKSIPYLLDPVKGTKIGYDGKAYREENSVLPTYTDISGHWCEDTVKTLLENGYYIVGDKFNPNQKMTQESFLRYLFSPMQAYYNADDFYKMMESNGVFKSGEKAPNKELTRQDAAKYVVRYLGQEKAASFNAIYKNPFKDVIPQEYMGYVALANAFKIFEGDKNGKFNGSVVITNSEGATIIFRTLQVK